jgi:putative ABC transport system permease protein
MLGNYLLLTFRHLGRQRLFTLVTLLSLAIGMAVALLILNYVTFERSYDTMHPAGDRLYRVESRFYEGDELTDDWATSSYGYGPAMQQAIPGIERIVRFDINNPEQIVRYGDRQYRESGITSVDSTFFDLFGFRLREGDPNRALAGPNKVVLTPYAAAKYFPEGEDPIGKIMTFNSLGGKLECEVTGILEELPRNSHIRFDFFISWSTLPRWLDNYWYRHEVYTYVRLAPGVDPRRVEAAFPALAESHKTEEALRNKTWRVVLNPIEEVHLTPRKQYEREAKGNRNGVNTLVLVAWAILAIAWINYINLATARSLERAREVGIRKVSGATRRQLIGQFILESAVVNGIALLLACGLVSLAAPWFDRLTGQPVGLVMLARPGFWIAATGVFTLGVLLSGFYPAFVISNTRPVEVLKGRYVHSRRAGSVRKCLVVVQFTAALVLLAGTFTVHRQLAYMRSQPLGIEINRLFAIRYPGSTPGLHSKMEAYKRELRQLGGVESVSLSGAIPGMEVATFLSNRLTGDAERQNRLYEMLVADDDYLETYGMRLVSGRGFGEAFTGDEDRMVINEAAARTLGFARPEEAIGRRVTVETREDRPMEIVGVLADYHQQGLGNTYTPIMAIRESAIDWLPRRFVSVRFAANAPIDALLRQAEVRWERLFADSPFDAFFVDRFYDQQYRAESRFGTIFALFAGLALSIALVGLWTLSLFAANRRRKELGVRKVFGATGPELFYSLSSEFLGLVAAAVVVGVPLAWAVMSSWLSRYPFRMDISPWLFAVPALTVVAVTLATVGGQVWLTLRANPVRALRSE